MTNTADINRSHLINALNDAVRLNSALIASNKATFVIAIAADAIIDGEVTPDTNDGAITDEIEALAFGAIVSDGPWWVADGVLQYRQREQLQNEVSLLTQFVPKGFAWEQISDAYSAEIILDDDDNNADVARRLLAEWNAR